MKIKIKYHNPKCRITQFGDWIDLRSAEDVNIPGPKYVKGNIQISDKIISLGVSIELPKYMEANAVPRSSSYKNYGFIQANHMGVIDYKYCGDDDVWKLNVIALKELNISEGDRVCQFRIRPTQDAPWYIKLRWVFTNKIKFVEVSSLGNTNRGGFGSTNKK